jgi:hypothetical protein
MSADFEKLGVFYLGKQYDPATSRLSDSLVLYDSKDLVTHAICVGMTGSGKTGLCLAILEEAAIDGIPAIIIDPKGDLANLLLTFPQLRGEDFVPWINEDDARQKGMTPADYAAKQAETWKKGLADWGQNGERIQRLKDAADFAVYTPGSNAGIGVSIIKSFAAPEQAIRDDGELLRERIATTATSLLGLLGVDADPIQSREHILISTILGNAWQNGKDLDLPALIAQIQQPPVTRVGVMDVDSFFPSKDRFALAMRLNNLLAAPGFSSWLEGQPLDIQSILYTPAGTPRMAIFSIAHLGDAERMFFVSLLLNQVLGWMRQQPGTSSLRAIVYMDEIFGYFPPVANPPSKQPLLTLMKQARAFGVGMVLATQNPVDLDYKGLANAGTWFIGRLQTERDKARLLDGLEGAAAGQNAKFDRGEMEQLLSKLGKRVFLMNNVHDDQPIVFQSRWALSYLRGPLTRTQIKALMDARETKGDQPATPGVASASPSPTRLTAPAVTTSARPVLDPGITQLFIPVRTNPTPDSKLIYKPMLLGCATIYFADAKTGVDEQRQICSLAPITTTVVPVDWASAETVELTEEDLDRDPQPAASFADLPPVAAKAKSFDAWKASLAEHLYRTQSLQLLRSPTLKMVSQPGENERDFRVRLSQSAREQRDEQVERLRAKYASKFTVLQDRIRRADQAVQREQEQASASKWNTAISVGSTLLGAFLGRKVMSAGNIGRATTAARGASRTVKESSDVNRAGENVQAFQQQLADLQAQFDAESGEIVAAYDPQAEAFETIALKPKKTNITVPSVILAWAPHLQSAAGDTPAF